MKVLVRLLFHGQLIFYNDIDPVLIQSDEMLTSSNTCFSFDRSGRYVAFLIKLFVKEIALHANKLLFNSHSGV